MSMLERSDIQLLPESLLRHADLSARNDKASPGATWFPTQEGERYRIHEVNG